jgi:2-polyprenyl-3-methyl-5-hydroxy-6-metoxy-1,4-benzoquinol methylase
MRKNLIIILTYFFPFCGLGRGIRHLRNTYARENKLHNALLLDVGCASGFSMSIIKKFFKGSSIGLDINPFMCRTAKKTGLYQDVVLGDASRPPFANKFDYCIAFEVIEHLSKRDGYMMLKNLRRISRNVILTTPNGFHARTDSRFGWSHISGWYAHEIHGYYGYRVYGAPGLQGRTPLKFLSFVIQLVYFPLIYFMPKLKLVRNLVIVYP